MPRHPGILIAAVLLTTPLSSTAGTTTTTYTYNADGALTAMTVRAEDDAATATYVTWDNFVLDAAAPAPGTLSVGNGRLAAIGAAPGGRLGYGFDLRDRLTTAPAADAAAVSYADHAGGLLAEATQGDAALGFTFGAGRHPRLINHSATAGGGGTSAMLAPIRFVDNGTEQLLLIPRKDVQGLYTPATDAVAAYDGLP